MRRTKAQNRRIDLFGVGKDGYHYNDDIPGSDATYVEPGDLNAIQEELANLVQGSGQALSDDNSDLGQVLKAVKIIAGQTSATLVNVSATLTPAQRGLVLVDATGGDVIITLPSAAAALDYVIRRADNSGNKVIVQCTGAEKVLHNTHVNAAGYGFIRLFGAGDFWWLRSNQVSAWWPLMRLDPTPIGRLSIDSGTPIPPGGYTKPNGSASFLRADFPWLWDYAGISGNLRSDVSWAADNWGGFSTGDGATTFRVLELRGEFIRIFDDSRGVDAGRGVGSYLPDETRAHNHSYRKVQAGASPVVASGSGAVLNADDTAVTGNTGGSETHPRSVALPSLLKII